MKRSLLIFVAIALFAGACSKEETRSYEDMLNDGDVEQVVRKRHRKFLQSIETLAGKYSENAADVDSTDIADAAKITDMVIGKLLPFPTTLESRLALDALSYAAGDFASTKAVDVAEADFFWRTALLDPIFVKATEYVKSDKPNDSTITQLITALKRGMAERGTNDMLLDAITVVGPNPPERVMKICEDDSLVFRKVFDLLVYSRSLQEIGPPLWMMTGSWLLGISIEGWPLSFYCLKPIDLNGSFFLTFRDYTQGEVYSSVYNDPVPEDTAGMDGWLSRASAAMDSLRFNDAFAGRVENADLPVWGTHNYYRDYMVSTTADSARSEFRIIFKRDRVVQDTFQFAGVDSIEVLFERREILSRAETITPLKVQRFAGDTMVAGRLIPARSGAGYAFLMPMGVHDEELIRKYQESLLPKITVGTE